MTSRRKYKKQAKSLGLSDRELQLTELLEEVLEQMRWLWVLGYSNQYLVNQKLEIDKAERDKILDAAARLVEKDGKLHEWQQRLARIKGEVTGIKRGIDRAKKDLAQESRKPTRPAKDPAKDTAKDPVEDGAQEPAAEAGSDAS